MIQPSHSSQSESVRGLVLNVLVLAVIVSAGFCAPWLAPYPVHDLKNVRLENSDLGPSWLSGRSIDDAAGFFLLGTDSQGRDIASAILYGLRISLLVGVLGTLIAMSAGTLLGLVAGYSRSWLDTCIMRIADIQLAFPSILIAMFLMALWGQGIEKIIIAIAMVHWVIYARLTRGRILAEREKDYISAIRVLGGGSMRILARHLLPNVATSVLAVSAIEFSSIVMLEATLSFLGLGVPRTKPSLGMLVQFGYEDFFSGNWWVWLFPGLTLVILILSINWMADHLHRKLGWGGNHA
jgi:peptide/nickel transport system permease protein